MGGRHRAIPAPWADLTQFGNYFNGETDSLDLKTKRLIGFDMTTVLSDPTLAPPIIDYFVHKIRNISLETGDPSLIFIDETAVSLNDFRLTFSALVKSRKPKSVYLRADRRVPYGDVVRVLATIRASGISDVGLVAEEESRP